MKPESKLWKRLKPILVAAKLDPVRVENPIHPGTPDVNTADGKWLELKCIPSWPVRSETNVPLRHFTPQQRIFLYKRWLAAPGSTLLLLEVISEGQCLLFDGNVAAKVVGRGPMTEHKKHARVVLASKDLEQLPMFWKEKRP